MTAVTDCDHNFIVNQQGLKVCKECYFVETKLMPITKLKEIKEKYLDDFVDWAIKGADKDGWDDLDNIVKQYKANKEKGNK